jgi:hypothetical protein
MNANLETVRKRLEMQGFFGLSDTEVIQFNYWLRLAPAICLAWTAVGVYFASPVILGLLVPFALLGGLNDGHPFDVFYNRGIRYLLGQPRLPVYGRPRRFACFMASASLATTAITFALGVDVVGYALGGLMVVMMSIMVTTGFCVPSKIYGKLSGSGSVVVTRSGSV